MSAGYSAAVSDGLLTTAVVNADFAKLHLGDPGPAGLIAPSLTVLRKAITWTAPNGSGIVRSVADLIWTPAQTVADEQARFISYWSLVAGGVFQGSAALNVPAHTTATGLTLPAGTLTMFIPTAL